MITAVKNENPEDHFAKLDLSSIRYPSDSISIGMLRPRAPQLFDVGFAEDQPKFFLDIDRGHSEKTIGDLMYCERIVALKAYAQARGMQPPRMCESVFPDFSAEEELTELYPKWGLASGPSHAAELIRDIEKQAVALGKQKGR